MKNHLIRRESILERLLARTSIIDCGFVIDSKPSPCHIWQGPTSGFGRGGGYSRMSLNGQTVAVHLVAYTHYFGFIPGKKQIDHLCNQRCCWNPQHLDMTSHIQNQRRRAISSKGKP